MVVVVREHLQASAEAQALQLHSVQAQALWEETFLAYWSPPEVLQ